MMTIVCAWHKPEPIVIGTKEGPDETTDGICEACAAREFGVQSIDRAHRHRSGPRPVVRLHVDIGGIDQEILHTLERKERSMRKSRWLISKKINGCPALAMGSEETKEKAETIADEMKAFHLERCPNDRVEMLVKEVLL